MHVQSLAAAHLQSVSRRSYIYIRKSGESGGRVVLYKLPTFVVRKLSLSYHSSDWSRQICQRCIKPFSGPKLHTFRHELELALRMHCKLLLCYGPRPGRAAGAGAAVAATATTIKSFSTASLQTQRTQHSRGRRIDRQLDRQPSTYRD